MRLKLLVLLTAVCALAFGAWALQAWVQDEGEEDGGGEEAYLGVGMRLLDDEDAERLELPSAAGAYIAYVRRGSPADDAGLERGDVVVELDGQTVESPDDLAEIVRSHSPGDEVTITVFRNGRQQTLSVELGERNVRRRVRILRTPRPRVIVEPNISIIRHRGRLGIEYQELNPQLGEYFGVPGGEGVLVMRVLEDSPAQAAGLRAGDVIVSVGETEIESGRDLLRAIWGYDEEEPLEIVVIRRGERETVSVELESAPGLQSDIFIPRHLEELGRVEEQLEMMRSRLHDIDIELPDILFFSDEEGLAIELEDMHIPHIQILEPSILLRHLDPLLHFRLRINDDGTVVFNDREFDSLEEFEEYLESEEYEREHRELREIREEESPSGETRVIT